MKLAEDKIIVVYGTPQDVRNRNYLAQICDLSDDGVIGRSLPVTFYGDTPELAQDKARGFWFVEVEKMHGSLEKRALKVEKMRVARAERAAASILKLAEVSDKIAAIRSTQENEA